MYVLGFPMVKRVWAHSFQKIGTQKNCGQFGEWDPTTYTVEDSLFGTVEFHNGSILRLETSFALNIPEQSIMNVNFVVTKRGQRCSRRRSIPIRAANWRRYLPADVQTISVIFAVWKLS